MGHYNTPYTAKEKLKALNLWKSSTIEFVAHRYRCSERTLWRWKAQYDGTLESLDNKSHKPKTPHPNSHTSEEIKHIEDLIRRNPNIGLNELYGKLRQRYAYTRNPVSLYRYLKKHDMFLNIKKVRKEYKPKNYDTPLFLGEKWQMDVKYVPNECKAKGLTFDKRFYQYTLLDEASRERFLYAYDEQTAYNTCDFLRRAIIYFGYIPNIVQTDNGQEFTYIRETTLTHPLDALCKKLGIKHKCIKPRTPRHNGKVERSHRNDNNRFYATLHFYSLDDLNLQMKAYLKRSNNIPSSALNWLSPLEKRKQILDNWGVHSPLRIV